ncbi:sulfite exporter TauE/SafE family protein [Actinomyces bowdenii]|uniref:Probable membrane transporter protein n=1 Tax=Actinomyces bowdenii TaxID=131109 RepID=A0A3P1VDS4_9ACTO|nr:sulfite exporter TauE/SafE family protein [Actinomyces bowdenii]RRD30673.1 sulfite exporter TauE/SafE family protein [Actinomyces bowdenii]
MPPELPALSWILLLLAAALAGLAKTALPGAATIAVALCAAILPAKESTGLMLLLLMTGDLLAVRSYWHDADPVMLRRLVPSVVAGVAAGALLLQVASDSAIRRAIGVILLLLIALTLLQRHRCAAPGTPDAATGHGTASSRPARLLYGALAGLTTMVANAGGPVTSMYFLACRYPVRAFLGTTAWFFFAVNLVKLPFSIAIGLVNPTTAALAAAGAPMVVLAALAGRALADRMSQRLFEPIVIALTVLSALPLL